MHLSSPQHQEPYLIHLPFVLLMVMVKFSQGISLTLRDVFIT